MSTQQIFLGALTALVLATGAALQAAVRSRLVPRFSRSSRFAIGSTGRS
jgi:hypothetical protein